MDISLLNIPAGTYRMVVTVEDHCGNIGECIDTFVVACDINRQAGVVQGQLNDIVDLAKKHVPKQVEEGKQDATELDLSQRIVPNGLFELYQNRPNPFRQKTVIGFDIPEADYVQLSIYDMQGRRLKVIEGRYEKGYNQIELQYSDLKLTGLLYYQLETSKYSATRRMIVTP